jgi:hypothetical protein
MIDNDSEKVDYREIELGIEWYGEDNTDLRFSISGDRETWKTSEEFLKLVGPLSSQLENLSEALKEAKQSDPSYKIKCMDGSLALELVTKVMDNYQKSKAPQANEEIHPGTDNAYQKESTTPTTPNPHPAGHQQGHHEPETGSQASPKEIPKRVTRSHAR